MYTMKYAASDYKINFSITCDTVQIRTLVTRREVAETLNSDWNLLNFLKLFQTNTGVFK